MPLKIKTGDLFIFLKKENTAKFARDGSPLHLFDGNNPIGYKDDKIICSFGEFKDLCFFIEGITSFKVTFDSENEFVYRMKIS